MSLDGWEAKPHSSSVWPWTHQNIMLQRPWTHHRINILTWLEEMLYFLQFDPKGREIKKGPDMEPCGTPQVQGAEEETLTLGAVVDAEWSNSSDTGEAHLSSPALTLSMISPEPPLGSRHWRFLSRWSYGTSRPGTAPLFPQTPLWWFRTDPGPADTHSHVTPGFGHSCNFLLLFGEWSWSVFLPWCFERCKQEV